MQYTKNTHYLQLLPTLVCVPCVDTSADSLSRPPHPAPLFPIQQLFISLSTVKQLPPCPNFLLNQIRCESQVPVVVRLPYRPEDLSLIGYEILVPFVAVIPKLSPLLILKSTTLSTMLGLLLWETSTISPLTSSIIRVVSPSLWRVLER